MVYPGTVRLEPMYGSILGGTGVMVEFQLQSQGVDEVVCMFDGITVSGALVHPALALCVSPRLSRTGQVSFQFRIPRIGFIYESVFTSRKFISTINMPIVNHYALHTL